MSKDNDKICGRPVIGIMPTFNFEDSVLHMANRYVTSVIAAGGSPVILPITSDVEVYESILPILDGFLLSGGQDISPIRYGGDCNYCKLSESSPNREEIEHLILSYAKRFDLPVLGICRGMQVINVSFGGSLYEDIDDKFLSQDKLEAAEIHPPFSLGEGTSPAFPQSCTTDSPKGTTTAPDNPKPSHIRSSHWQEFDYNLPVHAVSVRSGSLLEDVLGPGIIMVNSMHHQGIKDLGEGLEACAEDPYGLVEAIESTEMSFLLGVQWHPEFFAAGGSMSPLFERLVTEARKRLAFDERPAQIKIMKECSNNRWPHISFS